MLTNISQSNYNPNFGRIYGTKEARNLLRSRLLSGKQIRKLRELKLLHRDKDITLHFDRACDIEWVPYLVADSSVRIYKPEKHYKNYLICTITDGKHVQKFKESFFRKVFMGPISFVKHMVKKIEKGNVIN